MKGPILSTLSQFYSVHRSLGERSPCKHSALSQFHMPFGERSPRGHSFTVSQFHSVRGPFGERSHCEHTFSFTVYKGRLVKVPRVGTLCFTVYKDRLAKGHLVDTVSQCPQAVSPRSWPNLLAAFLFICQVFCLYSRKCKRRNITACYWERGRGASS